MYKSPEGNNPQCLEQRRLHAFCHCLAAQEKGSRAVSDPGNLMATAYELRSLPRGRVMSFYLSTSERGYRVR